MRPYLVILALAAAGFSAQASAQTQNRFGVFMQVCQYRAALFRKSFVTGEQQKAEIERMVNTMPQARWDRMLKSCRTSEAKVPIPPRAPRETVVEKPAGGPQQIVPRPANAPMGEFYRCNAQTKLPDVYGTKVCGPVVFYAKER